MALPDLVLLMLSYLIKCHSTSQPTSVAVRFLEYDFRDMVTGYSVCCADHFHLWNRLMNRYKVYKWEILLVGLSNSQWVSLLSQSHSSPVACPSIPQPAWCLLRVLGIKVHNWKLLRSTRRNHINGIDKEDKDKLFPPSQNIRTRDHTLKLNLERIRTDSRGKNYTTLD